MYTQEQITNYINSKQLAWARTTQRSEQARLTGALELLNQGASSMYTEGSKRYKPYALKTLFIRAADFASWVTGNANNEFATFLRDNRLAFKNAYERKTVGVDYAEASRRISAIGNSAIRQLASFILRSGLRAHEALTYDGSGRVTGKGAKERSVYSAMDGANCYVTYGELYKELKRVGLKPHDLRKLAATKLVEAGLKEADLLKVMGWSSIETAKHYLQPKSDSELANLVAKVLV